MTTHSKFAIGERNENGLIIIIILLLYCTDISLVG